MDYRIDTTYCWYSDWLNKNTKIVLMYFINGIPFTFDDLEDLGESQEDMPSIKVIADNEIRYNTEELYNYYSYLLEEQFHPLLFELELENPEELPDHVDSYIEEDLME
tara:strand:- start:580 stop:903 length:324 start_codon:yes stop_codon:yes gene_type:complete